MMRIVALIALASALCGCAAQAAARAASSTTCNKVGNSVICN